MSSESMVEHPAQRHPIDRSRVNPNTNDSPREWTRKIPPAA
jgi:hypothetical protein